VVPLTRTPGARADYLTPDSSASPAAVTSPAADGTPVAPGGLAGEQYTRFGIELGHCALVRINNVLCWAPTTNWMQTTSAPDHLNFTSGLIAAAFGIPGTPNLARTGHVSVEFMNVLPSWGWIDGFDSQGRLLTFMNNTGVGPHGGTVATIDTPAVTGILLSKSTWWQDPTAGQPWGIAAIDFGPLAPVGAPEPSALLLGGLGGAGVLAARRLRGSASQEQHAGKAGAEVKNQEQANGRKEFPPAASYLPPVARPWSLRLPVAAGAAHCLRGTACHPRRNAAAIATSARAESPRRF
jgi:hypothetical protein